MQTSHPTTTPQVQDDLFGTQCVLVLVAVLEAFYALLDLPLIVDRPNLLFGPWAVMPTTLVGIILGKVHLVVHPLLAIAALRLTIAGNIRGALIALGAISVVTWLSFLPLVLQDGLPFRGWWSIQWTVAQLFVFPVLAGIVIALAVLTRRYRQATMLIAIPTGYNILGMVFFVISVVAANM